MLTPVYSAPLKTRFHSKKVDYFLNTSDFRLPRIIVVFFDASTPSNISAMIFLNSLSSANTWYLLKKDLQNSSMSLDG